MFVEYPSTGVTLFVLGEGGETVFLEKNTSVLLVLAQGLGLKFTPAQDVPKLDRSEAAASAATAGASALAPCWTAPFWLWPQMRNSFHFPGKNLSRSSSGEDRIIRVLPFFFCSLF